MTSSNVLSQGINTATLPFSDVLAPASDFGSSFRSFDNEEGINASIGPRKKICLDKEEIHLNQDCSDGSDLRTTHSRFSSEQNVVVDKHAASHFENWLTNYPAVWPSSMHLECLAFLTGLPSLIVQDWFNRRMRKHCSASPPTNAQNKIADSFCPQLSAKQETPAASIDDSPDNSEFLRKAALLGEKKERKCSKIASFAKLRGNPNEPYQCTLKCGYSTKSRNAWKRHEEQNYPQEGWVCTLEACRNQPLTVPTLRGGIFYQKHHALRHYKTQHPNFSPIQHTARLEMGHFFIASSYPKQCGFCIHQFVSWEERINHIAQHFRNSRSMLEWQTPTRNDVPGYQNQNNDKDDEDGPGSNSGRSGSDSGGPNRSGNSDSSNTYSNGMTISPSAFGSKNDGYSRDSTHQDLEELPLHSPKRTNSNKPIMDACIQRHGTQAAAFRKQQLAMVDCRNVSEPHMKKSPLVAPGNQIRVNPGDCSQNPTKPFQKSIGSTTQRTSSSTFGRLEGPMPKEPVFEDIEIPAIMNSNGTLIKKRLIIAVDLGTTYSSVSYYSPTLADTDKFNPSFHKSEVQAVVNYPGQCTKQHLPRTTVPTQICYRCPTVAKHNVSSKTLKQYRVQPLVRLCDRDKEGEELVNLSDVVRPICHDGVATRDNYQERVFWGYQVEHRDGDRDQDLSISNCKLLLHRSQNGAAVRNQLDQTLRRLRRKLIIGKREDVIAHFLTELLKHTKDQLTEHYLDRLHTAEFVLCVPSTWTPKGVRKIQEIMQIAVQKSGIGVTDAGGVKTIQFVSESEAAAAYILAQPSITKAGYPSFYTLRPDNRLTLTGYRNYCNNGCRRRNC